jgi:undecaprenyl-diphosphatase
MKWLHWGHTLVLRGHAWVLERELVVLAAALVVLAGVWGFIELADSVNEGGFQKFDERLLLAMRRPEDLRTPIGPVWMQEMGRDVTALGGIAWLVFFTLAVVGYLWLDGKRHMAVFLLIASGSGVALAFGLKEMFARPRPSIVPHLSHVSSSSFPSAHSMMSAVVYITLGSLLAAVVSRKRLKAYILTVALTLSIVVGISRVYLGVHYPTDVVAGWMAGVSWALLCWLAARWLQRHGDVEQPDDVVTQRTLRIAK